LCSEAEGYHLDWPSDIFVEVNDVELGVWTSPADFGGSRGRFTPAWWLTDNSQFGLVPTWIVDSEGTTVNGEPVSDVRIGELNLDQHSFVKVRLGVRPDAKNCGGMNIFGERSGNTEQGIVLKLEF
jgi:predicted transcriptional regulator